MAGRAPTYTPAARAERRAARRRAAAHDGPSRAGPALLRPPGDRRLPGRVPALLPFLIAARGFSVGQASLLVLAATVASSVLQPLFGIVSDRRSVPWLMPLGPLMGAVGIAAVALTSSFAADVRGDRVLRHRRGRVSPRGVPLRQLHQRESPRDRNELLLGRGQRGLRPRPGARRGARRPVRLRGTRRLPRARRARSGRAHRRAGAPARLSSGAPCAPSRAGCRPVGSVRAPRARRGAALRGLLRPAHLRPAVVHAATSTPPRRPGTPR